MRYASILVLFAVASCFRGVDALLVQGPSIKKQKQKIIHLQKKLETAEKEKERAESDVETLSREINEAQLALIRRQVDDYEKRKESASNLFMEEREALYRLIESGITPQAFDAQVELDRILRIITELSDEEKYVY